jgi:tRNA threonylcarbamoyladenosine biosynthesis protein TsaE
LPSLKLDISKESDLPEAAKKVLLFAGENRVFILDAPMGGGKTTFIKTLCRALGSTDNLSSPTYAIVNEYSSPRGKIYHFDLYRIKSVDELYDIGFEEYLSGGNYCFIEWPQIAVEFLPQNYTGIKFEIVNNQRSISAENHVDKKN